MDLRLNRGRGSERSRDGFWRIGDCAHLSETISECVDLGLLEREGDVIRLTGRGRLLSNEVFERFILPNPVCGRTLLSVAFDVGLAVGLDELVIAGVANLVSHVDDQSQKRRTRSVRPTHTLHPPAGNFVR